MSEQLIPGAPTATGTYFAVIKCYISDEPQRCVLHYQAHKNIYRAVGHAFNVEVQAEDIVGYVGEWSKQGAVWVKADTKPDHNVGVLVFIPGEDNHITSGMWDIDNKWVLLDEYRTPEEEVTHWMLLPSFPDGYTWNEIPGELVDALKKVAKEELSKRESPTAGREEDAVAFTIWCTDNYYPEHGYWWHRAGDDKYTIDYLYKFFKQQNEK